MLSGFEIVLIVIGSSAVISELLKHRLAMAKARNGQSTSVDHSVELEALRQRCASLEKRCDDLQLQVTDAHAQLTDERRELDRRLASVLPDDVPQVSDVPRRPLPAKTVM